MEAFLPKLSHLIATSTALRAHRLQKFRNGKSSFLVTRLREEVMEELIVKDMQEFNRKRGYVMECQERK